MVDRCGKMLGLISVRALESGRAVTDKMGPVSGSAMASGFSAEKYMAMKFLINVTVIVKIKWHG